MTFGVAEPTALAVVSPTATAATATPATVILVRIPATLAATVAMFPAPA
jgi:hypothetical protein